jgi:hypothetical protein
VSKRPVWCGWDCDGSCSDHDPMEDVCVIAGGPFPEHVSV